GVGGAGRCRRTDAAQGPGSRTAGRVAPPAERGAGEAVPRGRVAAYRAGRGGAGTGRHAGGQTGAAITRGRRRWRPTYERSEGRSDAAALNQATGVGGRLACSGGRRPRTSALAVSPATDRASGGLPCEGGAGPGIGPHATALRAPDAAAWSSCT